MTKTHNAHAPRAKDYLQTAKLLRERAPTMKSPEARDELRAMAQEYERLARFAEATKIRVKPRARQE